MENQSKKSTRARITKAEYEHKISEKSGQSLAETDNFLKSQQSVILETLGAGKDILNTGFCRWTVGHRKGYMGRNPQTGKPVPIKARNIPKCKPGKSLKEAVNH